MKRTAAIALLAAALLTGCGKPEDKFVGNWDGKLDVPQASIDQIEKQMPGAGAMAKAQIKDRSIALELKRDGTYALAAKTGAQTDNVTGTWTLAEDGKSIHMSAPEPDKATKDRMLKQGMTEEQLKPKESDAKDLKVSEDGKTLSVSESNMGISVTLTFTKK